MAPYGYLLAGLTLITIESSGLTQPDNAWSVALSRTEEIFVGIITVLIITPLFRLRRPRLEFQQLASSAIEQLTHLTDAKLRNIREGTSSTATLRQEETALVVKYEIQRRSCGLLLESLQQFKPGNAALI
jgi:Fusaric acid resistance protein family